MSDVVLIYPKTGMDISATIMPPHSLLCVAAPLVVKEFNLIERGKKWMGLENEPIP